MGLRDPMTAAEQIARRYYKDNHFDSQATAERAYFRILAEWLQRGRELARLSRRLGKARERGNCLARINADLRLQLGQAKVAGAARVDPSPLALLDALLGQLASEQMQHLEAADRYDRAGDTAGNAHAELKAARICREHFEAVMTLRAALLVPTPPQNTDEDDQGSR